MSGVAFDLPEDVLAVRDGVLRFVEAQIVPRLDRHRSVLEDQRGLYDETGRYSPKVRALIREVRMLSAEAGFYAMCAPVELPANSRHLDTYFTNLTLTDKSFHVSAIGRGRALDGIEMMAIARGLTLDQMRDDPGITTIISVNSPRRFDDIAGGERRDIGGRTRVKRVAALGRVGGQVAIERGAGGERQRHQRDEREPRAAANVAG